MPTVRARWRARISAWLTRWRALLPLFAAELIVLIGFGALLPVLPLYVQEQGIDATGLGFVIAAWPIAKLIFEPVFGWTADRGYRRQQMIAGLVILAVASVLPLVLTSFAWLFVLRFVAGMATALYDPAARGIVVDATDEDERGEAFGYYGAFQIGGLAIGPAIGGFGAAIIGGYSFPFVFVGALAVVGAIVVWRFLDAQPRSRPSLAPHHYTDERALPAGDPFTASETAVVPSGEDGSIERAPASAVFNKMVVSALVLTFGLHLAFGTYEVIWSIYLIALGATVAWVGFTFVAFAVPMMIISPVAGRVIDRRGPVGMVLGSGVIILVSGVLYATATDFIVPSVVVPFEAGATAAMTPALYAILARGTPAGRSSTAQGVFGAVSTLALVVASMGAGWLFEQAIPLPFWFFVVGMTVCLVAGLLIYRGALRDAARGQEPEGAGAAP